MRIDYFEFTVLVEASWHAGTILRHTIMAKAINVWYHDLRPKDREAAYNFFNRIMADSKDLEIQKRFFARFNPNNQYEVKTKFNGLTVWTDTYRFEDKYWINTSSHLNEDYIITVNKLQLKCTE